MGARCMQPGCQVSGLENSKWKTKIHSPRPDSSVSGEEGHSDPLSSLRVAAEAGARLSTTFGFNWGQSYLATLVTPQNCTKILRNLTFVVQFAFFCIRPNKGREQQQKIVFFFLATFDQLSSNFLRIYGKLFGKSRATCGKSYSPLPHNLLGEKMANNSDKPIHLTMAYCISRTGLDWAGFVKWGLGKRGLGKRGLGKRGLLKRGFVNADL